ncbi:hypothetical protein C2845_PM12G06770 [Panicum miliaceum]|uniref:Uncharacterized protein n=1 Tax=Panicum miliaceum TaxID=4540 RepID=A0A3L6QGE0_PANMI|nr:hypothetical protein C2845_PM12G06770 [Panicum miliaceum]
MLLMVPLKISDILPREGGWLHGRQVQPSATGTIGTNLQGFDIICFIFKVVFVSFEV